MTDWANLFDAHPALWRIDSGRAGEGRRILDAHEISVICAIGHPEDRLSLLRRLPISSLRKPTVFPHGQARPKRSRWLRSEAFINGGARENHLEVGETLVAFACGPRFLRRGDGLPRQLKAA
jgi:hypothetical protein